MHGLLDPTASLTNAARASGCEACPKATGSPTEMTADAGPFATGPRGSMRRRPGAAGRLGGRAWSGQTRWGGHEAPGHSPRRGRC